MRGNASTFNAIPLCAMEILSRAICCRTRTSVAKVADFGLGHASKDGSISFEPVNTLTPGFFFLPLAMAMLLQHIRRATFSRRRATTALTPPSTTLSRFYSTNNGDGALRLTNSETFNRWLAKPKSKFLLESAVSALIIYVGFHWDEYYGDTRKATEELELIFAEVEKERMAIREAEDEFHKLMLIQLIGESKK